MKFLFIFITFILYAICTSASHASESVYVFNNPLLTREERLIKLQIEKHPNRNSNNETVRPIDGADQAIEISSTRTSLPNEYLPMPTPKKDLKNVAGN